MQWRRAEDAIAFFELNTQEHPNSSNTFDSLAEAYTKKGHMDLAIQNYQKALSLDPMNENAKDKLHQLQNK